MCGRACVCVCVDEFCVACRHFVRQHKHSSSKCHGRDAPRPKQPKSMSAWRQWRLIFMYCPASCVCPGVALPASRHRSARTHASLCCVWQFLMDIFSATLWHSLTRRICKAISIVCVGNAMYGATFICPLKCESICFGLSKRTWGGARV